ncbi:hypothetical protein G3I19_32335 [Streptomyces sp. SID10853]|uniref:trypsin-like serine peptidase n=1 Tax=Streptomyces sp. SID10853 TaxID=2706028 RepID=UPI0013BFD48A|nr:hypothetical protein [Streptomyces sp. SID10853]NDZ83132.1 hypothetical protein [Streptomyces sp. SID10853]
MTVGTQAVKAQDVRDYWTPARVARALANEKSDDDAFARKAGAAVSAAKASGTTGATLGLRAERGQVLAADRRQERAAAPAAFDVPEMPVAQKVPFPQNAPAIVVGKILFTEPDGSDHGCSGASIAADGGNTVWTAGHCVHPGDGTGAESFWKDITFIPGFKENAGSPDGYDAPWGKWTASTIVAPEEWTQDGDPEDADMAAFNVTVPAGYTSLSDSVGALGYKFGYGSDWSDVIDSGFPGDGYHRTDMDGYTQFYCTGNAEDAADFNPLDNRLKVDCDMGHGASGGPIATTDAQIVGANSHIETEDDGTRKNDDLFSSDHADNAVAVINRINELN